MDLGTQKELLGVCRDGLASVLSVAEPQLTSSADAVEIWRAAVNLERLATALIVLFAERASDSGTWKDTAAKSAAEWMAQEMGSTTGDAKGTLNTSEKLGSGRLGATEDALRRGELSGKQAEKITDAATANPSAEKDLLANARGGGSMRDLDEACGDAKKKADRNPEATRRRIHRRRKLTTWTASDGAFHLHARGTVEDGAQIAAAIAALVDPNYRCGKAPGEREPYEAYAFDALVELADLALHSQPNANSHPSANAPIDDDAGVSPLNAARLLRRMSQHRTSRRGRGPEHGRGRSR